MSNIAPKITIIGAGRLARNLTDALSNAGMKPMCIINRTLPSAVELANTHKISLFSDRYEDIPKDTGLILLSISDDAIQTVAKELLPYVPIPCIVAHSSGVSPIDILSDFHFFGLFYPLASFHNEGMTDMSSIPIIIHGNTEGTISYLENIARKLSHSIYHLQDNQRQYLHLAAVFANNFINQIAGSAYEILEQGNIPRDILYPILRQTMENIIKSNPADIQTGPAVRQDIKTMGRHLNLLRKSGNRELEELYLRLSAEILHTHFRKEELEPQAIEAKIKHLLRSIKDK